MNSELWLHLLITVTPPPFAVITELDGLSKGSKEGQYDSFEHAEKVRKRAQSTVEFLEREFEARNSHLRAITSKGNVMDTIAFRSEEVTMGVSGAFVNACMWGVCGGCVHVCARLRVKAMSWMRLHSGVRRLL